MTIKIRVPIISLIMKNGGMRKEVHECNVITHIYIIDAPQIDVAAIYAMRKNQKIYSEIMEFSHFKALLSIYCSSM